MANNQNSLIGAFVPSTNIWDVGEIYALDNVTPEIRELLVRLYQNLNIMSLAVNVKDVGYYSTELFMNGQLFFPNPNLNSSSSTLPDYRPVFRSVINFGALPNAGLKSVPHHLFFNSGTTFTRIYGAASDTTGLTYIPLPYASPTLANNIELSVDAVNVNITTGANRTNYNVCYVVLEYITT